MGDDNPQQAMTDEEREEILELYDGLRVADVTDGLDYHGFHNQNRVSNDIGPLYRDVEDFSHQITGFAYTARYLPTNERRDLPHYEELDFQTSHHEWAGEWWTNKSPDPDTDAMREGDILVAEAHDMEVGIFGSFNLLTFVNEGVRGLVTDGGPRDTDEVIKQGIPVYSKEVNKTIPPGRAELAEEGVPVNISGCQIRPGDVVVADGDGVVTVPIEHARTVAETAWEVLENDQDNRREYYDKVGLEHDFTLE